MRPHQRRGLSPRRGTGPPPSLSLRRRVCHPKTRTHVALLGPCFKTGRMRPFGHQRPQRKVWPASLRAAGTVEGPLHAVTDAADLPAGATQPRERGLRCRVRETRSSPQSRSGTPQNVTPGYKVPAQARGHLPAAPSWAGDDCRWPAPRRSADRSGDRPAGRGSNRRPAGVPPHLS